jgi:hypothetical protein
MKIYTKICIDMSTGAVVESDFYEYTGEVALCKGDSTDQQTEQLEQQNTQAQLAQNQQLMNIMQTQYGAQSQIYNYMSGKMTAMMNNPTGYSQQQLTSMQTSANDNLTNQYQSAQQALNQSEFTNGSRDLPSGVNDQLNASLLNSEASDKASAQNQITQANANLQQQNYWNAANALSGVAAGENPLGYASAATGASNAASSAGNSTANLSNAYMNSQQSQLESVLGGAVTGIGSSLIGGAAKAGGFSSLFS